MSRTQRQRLHECLHFRAEDHTRRMALRVTNHCCEVPTQQEDALCLVYLILRADWQIQRLHLVYPSYIELNYLYIE